MDIKKIIEKLTSARGASGSEANALAAAKSELEKYCIRTEIKDANLIGIFREYDELKPNIVLDAHIDQIGMIVTYITDEGFIKVGNLGGIDRRLLPAQAVTVHGKSSIPGVVCSVPPHLSKGSEDVLSFDDVSIDTGLTKEELEEIVSPGDVITFDTKCRSLLGSRIASGALDDRCGCAAVLRALELIGDAPVKYNVIIVFSAQEELGERGAKTAAFTLDPDIALAVDVSFAFAIGENENKCGYLGKGPMIGISPCLSREISDELISVSKSKEIPYQIEVMNDLTSTNADQYSVSRGGARVCTISIPLRNMHTPVEVIDLSDVDMTGRLIAEFIKEAE